VRQGKAIHDRHYTDIEVKFQEALERRGLRKGIDFATQFPLRHSFILDFAFKKQKVAVEVDGTPYHSSPKARQRDAFKNLTLKRLGWKVFRFWDHKIHDDLEACVDKVMEAVLASPGK